MIRKIAIVLLFSFMAVLLGGQMLPAEEQNFVVIVNKSNNVSSLSKSQVSRMFLKKVFTWKDGSSVKPIDLTPDSPVRKIFSQEIHGRNVYSIKNYWQQMIFAGRDVPPLEKETEQEIIDYVSSHPEAVGYVSSKTNLDSVKIIEVIY